MSSSRLLLSVIAVLLLLPAGPVAAGPVCDFWKKATPVQRKEFLSKIADSGYAPVYEKEWPAIRGCVDTTPASAMGDVERSCLREGDYSAGFVMGFSFHLTVVKCFANQDVKP